MKTLTKEELRKVQLLELKILKEIKRICDKYGIRYFLTGGTLIGAVRHKGFVPWDDDIDIGMLREDYDKFIEIAPKELDSEKFSILNIQTNKKIGIFQTNVILKGTVYRNVQKPADFADTGFFVDILPYDNIYDNNLLAAFYFKKITFYVILYALKNGYRNGTTKLKRIIAYFMKIFFFFLPKEYLRKKIIGYPYKLNKKKTKRVSYLTGRYGSKKESKNRYFFDEFTEVQFEDEKFSCVMDYDAFLRECYGDYMQLPPESKRVTHQIEELYFGEY